MESGVSFRRGCLLGIAIGDALGYATDGKSWEEIRRDYGDSGLQGYDLKNSDWAEITSYTQLAAFTACGLLSGLTRSGDKEHLKYITGAMQEWAQCQKNRAAPYRGLCWVAQLPQLRRRTCMDTRMVESLTRWRPGSLRRPANSFSAPSAITAAAAVGVFFEPGRMDPTEIGILAAQTVALTHGDPETFLAGAVVAYVLAGILQDPELTLAEQYQQAVQITAQQFEKRHPQEMAALTAKVNKAISMVKHLELEPRQVMEMLGCGTAAECMAGAMYACLIHPGNFDEAVTVAVNHGGRTCATGALTGAIMGARLGDAVLKDFYLESLECTQALLCLADDLDRGKLSARIFDDSWDQKYIQGQPVLE